MVHTGTYQYVPVQQDSPRKSQERYYKGCTAPMHGIQCDEVEFQNCSSLVNSWYILVHTGTYWYVQARVQTSTKQHTSFDHALSALRRLRVSAGRFAWSFRTVSFRMAVSFTVRPPRRGLPRPKFHSQLGVCIPTVF